MTRTFTSRGTVIETKAVLKQADFDLNDFVTQSEKVRSELSDICKYKGVHVAEYMSRLPEVAQDILGILKDAENRIIREIESLFPITNDRSDPEIKGVRLFGDLILDYIVSIREEKIVDHYIVEDNTHHIGENEDENQVAI